MDEAYQLESDGGLSLNHDAASSNDSVLPLNYAELSSDSSLFSLN
ncbi:hypothetical protein [Bacillus sp. PS06]|nr:hypothetical protein [Bacillus sp. PS06]